MENKKVLVILAHPDAKNSFNGAIAQRTIDVLSAQGYEPVFRDLYAEGFDPIMTLAETKEPSSAAPLAMQKEMQAVKECAGMVFIHPNWWGAPPAILLGWIDLPPVLPTVLPPVLPTVLPNLARGKAFQIKLCKFSRPPTRREIMKLTRTAIPLRSFGERSSLASLDRALLNVEISNRSS